MSWYPKVTIVIPVYNGSNYLEEAIGSALAQTYQNIEVIVVNDGSTDGGATESIARRYEDRITYISQENRGVGGALNTAITEMTGDFLTWLSHDDIHLPTKVEAQLEYYSKLEKRDAILFSNYYLINELGDIWHECKWNFEEILRKPLLPLMNGLINGCSIFIPVHIIREFGPFNERLRQTQDYDLWNKILSKYDFFLQPETLIKYRTHGQQDSKKLEVSTERDAETNELWVNLLESRSEIQRVHLFGSALKYWASMAKFLEDTPYKRAAEYARRREERVIPETLVSVIIPFFNDVEYVVRAVHSVLGQTHKRIELILVDDGSTDDIAAVEQLAKAHVHISLLRQPNAGPGAARNLGLEAARGDYIAFLDADDVFVPQKIEKQLTAMQDSGSVMSHTSYDVIFPERDSMFPEREPSIETQASATFSGRVYPEIIASCPIATPTVMIHRSLVSEGFEFGTSSRLGEDIMAWTWSALRHDLLGIPESLTIVERSYDTAAIEPNKQLEGLGKLFEYFSGDTIHRKQQEALDRLSKALDWYRSVLKVKQEEYARELVQLAERLTSNGQAPEAIRHLQHALQLWPSEDALIRLGVAQRVLGNHDEALQTFSRVIATYGDERVLGALGLTQALSGHLPDAIASFRSQVSHRPDDDIGWYHLASCLTSSGELEEAQEIFSRGLLVPLGDGQTTSTTMITLLPDENTERPGVAFNFLQTRQVHFAFNPIDGEEDDIELVCFACCDSKYLRLFGHAFVRSIEQNAGVECLIHFHVVGLDQDSLQLIELLCTNRAIKFTFSYEMTDLEALDDMARRTFYSCARFLVLPELLQRYQKMILVMDIDQLVIKNITGFLHTLQGHDAGLLYFSTNSHNVMSSFSASILSLRPSGAGIAYACRVRDYLIAQMHRHGPSISWHLDQIALAASVLHSPDLAWWAIPPKLMQSELVRPGGHGTVDPEALFWSVTFSESANAEKLTGDFFRQFAAPELWIVPPGVA